MPRWSARAVIAVFDGKQRQAEQAEEPATERRVPEYHWGHAWSPTQDEATCPCPKAPCGYVVRSQESPECEHHGPMQTMRGGHPADRCPAERREG